MNKEKKNVLVYFTGSDWCQPCITMKKDFFETSAFDKYTDCSLIVVRCSLMVDGCSEIGVLS